MCEYDVLTCKVSKRARSLPQILAWRPLATGVCRSMGVTCQGSMSVNDSASRDQVKKRDRNAHQSTLLRANGLQVSQIQDSVPSYFAFTLSG